MIDLILKRLKRYGIILPTLISDEADLRKLLDQAGDRRIIAESQREMMQSVLDLGDTLVRELMVPRTDIVYIENTRNLRQGLSLALRSGFTRIPVISENLDNVLGVAYVKDITRRIHEHRESEQSETVADHVRLPTFVPENKIASDLLKEMQRDQIHMAIVIDEYGGTAGLITIEDILEEIVGEIVDEYDVESDDIEWVSDDQARVDARLNIDDFEEAFNVILSPTDREDVDSVGGLLSKHLGRVPIPGSQISLAGWIFEAERPVGRRHRISTVLVSKEVESINQSDSDEVDRAR
jgi:CBS domain containing-hemolysin-like protein